MKIYKKKDALSISKPEGINVDYYLFPEYELHYNEQAPHSIQVWHHHNKIRESIFILEGNLVAKWREGEKELVEILNPGDLVETENTPHTFSNDSDTLVKFLVIKQVPHEKDLTETLKSDKVLD